MIRRLRFLALYFLFWIGCFEGGRVLFLLYQWKNTVRLNASLIIGILVHGLRMDISLVCAVMLIPLCIVARSGFLPPRTARRMIGGYTVMILAIWALATIADLELFTVWGYRLDASPLHYLQSSREVLAAVAGSPLLLLSLLLLVVLVAGTLVFSRGLLPQLDEGRFPQLQSILLMAVVTPCLTVGTRGGLDWRIPISTGSVYFSNDNFANQAAINPVWNFFADVISGSGEGAVEPFTSPQRADAVFDSLVAEPAAPHGERPIKLLRMRPTRIVIVFWESFTAKIAEPLGGMPGITPGFTRLAKQGVLFDNFYASGQRTTNGIVSGLTGFPSHPRTNPLKSEELGTRLPRLSVTMSRNGYRTGFYYGASLSFDSRNRFLLHGHYDEVVERKDFDRTLPESPWGVHDPYVFDRLFNSLNTTPRPLFAATLTLSSHEPYEVPGPPIISGSSAEQKFLNSQAYTDRALTQFIERAQRRPWWDSTLVIILADHGAMYPEVGAPLGATPQHFHIPMLWIGGAVAGSGAVIHRIGSQSDIPETLLAQLGIERENFLWSKDFLAPGARQFAFYAFRDGFGYVDPKGSIVFDNVAKSVIFKSGAPQRSSLEAGRAFQQVITQAYHDLSSPRQR